MIRQAPRVRIHPSILTADLGHIADLAGRLALAGADGIHLDVMDGRFVPNLTFGPIVVGAFRRATSLPLDVHLMIESPESHIVEFVRAGADSITVHAEACPHLHRAIQLVRAERVRAGVAINPATPIAAIEALLEDVDMVLCMTVNPGFGGQSFIESVLPKVKALRDAANARGLHQLDIEVDGGINESTLAKAKAAGANVFVAGSAIVGADDWRQAIAKLRAAGG